MSGEATAVGRVGESLVMRFDGRHEVVTCVEDDGRAVVWESADGARRGPMEVRYWDLNRARQDPDAAAAEGGGA